MLVVNGHRQHQPIERQHPGMIGDHQGGTIARQVLDTADFHAEPRPEKEPQQRPNDRTIEVRIEPGLVNGVVTREPLAEESGNRGDALSQLVERCLGGRCCTRGQRRCSSISRTTAAICSADARPCGSASNEGC